MPSLVALALAIGFGAILAGAVIGDAFERREQVAAEWATPALVQAVEAAVAASGACRCRVSAGGLQTCLPASRWPASGGYPLDWAAISAELPGEAVRDLLDGVAPEAEVDRGTGSIRVTLTAGDPAEGLLLERMAVSGGLEATKERTGSELRIHLPPLGDGGLPGTTWRMDSGEHFPRARCAAPRPLDLSYVRPQGPANTNGWTHPWK